MGLLLDSLHGGTEIVLLLAFQQASGALSTATDVPALMLEGAAYTLPLILTGFLLVGSLRALGPSSSWSFR